MLLAVQSTLWIEMIGEAFGNHRSDPLQLLLRKSQKHAEAAHDPLSSGQLHLAS